MKIETKGLKEIAFELIELCESSNVKVNIEYRQEQNEVNVGAIFFKDGRILMTNFYEFLPTQENEKRLDVCKKLMSGEITIKQAKGML